MAQSLGCRVTKHLLGRLVPRDNRGRLVDGQDRVAGGFHHCAEPLLAVPLGLFRPLAGGDVAGDAEGADDPALRIAQRHLGRRDPGVRAIRPGLPLLQVNHRLAGLHDALFILERLQGVLVGEQIEIGLPHHGGDRPAIAAGFGRADRDEARLAVLEIDVVRQALHQRAEEKMFLYQDLPVRLGLHVHLRPSFLGAR